MRIIQIGPFPLDQDCVNGGVEASVYGLAVELANKHEISVFDIPRKGLNNDKVEFYNNFKVFRFSLKGTRNYASILRLKTILRLVQKQKPDVCHVHTTSLINLLIYLLLNCLRIPVIVTVHGLVHIEKRKIWKKQPTFRNFIKYVFQSLVEFIFLDFCPFIIVDTPYVSNTIKQYKKSYKIIRMPFCYVIPQGIRQDFFNIGNNTSKNHLFSVGAFANRKGHLFLIDAMVKISKIIPDFSLTIAGNTTDLDYFKLMQEKIILNGLVKNITIIPNATFKKIIDIYENSEIFILHSEEESQGIVFCEAMAAGKSIVTTNVGGIPWVVNNNVNGLLSEFGDLDNFTENILTLMQNIELRIQIGKNNKFKSMNYEWKIVSNKIVDLYNTLIKKNVVH